MVRVTSTVERTIRNISQNTERLKAFIVVDEWGFTEPTHIRECRLEHNHKVYSDFNVSKAKEKISAETEEVNIGPNNTATLFYNTTEIKRENDHITGVWLSPTRRPELEIHIPERFDQGVEFGRAEYRVQKERYGDRYILQGTYFPHQHVRVRWWPKQDND